MSSSFSVLTAALAVVALAMAAAQLAVALRELRNGLEELRTPPEPRGRRSGRAPRAHALRSLSGGQPVAP
jgi:hypothetical protein